MPPDKKQKAGLSLSLSQLVNQAKKIFEESNPPN